MFVEYDSVREMIPRVLTIAGSDSGGGAGIQADLKTFTALKVFGMSAITSVTAQNTNTILGISDLPAEFVGLQIDAVVNDLGVDAVKIGMLSNIEIIETVAEKINQYSLKQIVLDPVMVTSSGDPLLRLDAQATLIKQLFPLTTVLTPNIPESEVLTGLGVKSIEEMKKAAQRIKALGPEYVLLKGGHLDKSSDAVDILYDGVEFFEFPSKRIDTKNTHGTGCTYSAAICAGLAKGLSIIDAVKEAKEYVTLAIQNSFELGKGYGPLNHFCKID